jgi:uncharacterized membrane protein
MSRYELFLFLHVTSVIVWLGAGTTLALVALFAGRTGDRELLGRLGPIGGWLGPRVFGPAALGALVFGLVLVDEGSWSFDPLWIKLGLGAFAVSFVLNAGVRVPLIRRLQRGADPARTGRILGLLPRFELTVLYLTVADMIAKPTGADTGTLIAGGSILGLVATGVAVGVAR